MLDHQGSIFFQAQSHLHLFRMQIKLLPKLCNVLESMPYTNDNLHTKSYILIPGKKYIGALKQIQISFRKHILPHCTRASMILKTEQNYYLDIAVKNVMCVQIVKRHKKLHQPLAKLLHSERTAHLYYFVIRNHPKINERKLSHEPYLLRKVGIISSFNSFSPGKRRNKSLIKMFHKVQRWKD